MTEGRTSAFDSIISAKVHKKNMTVIKEEGGRYNAFAKEPKIEVLNTGSSISNGFRLIILAGAALLIGLIAYTVRIS